MRAGGVCTDWIGSSFDIPFGVLVNEWMLLCARWIGYQATGRRTGSADGHLTHQAVAQKAEHPLPTLPPACTAGFGVSLALDTLAGPCCLRADACASVEEWWWVRFGVPWVVRYFTVR